MKHFIFSYSIFQKKIKTYLTCHNLKFYKYFKTTCSFLISIFVNEFFFLWGRLTLSSVINWNRKSCSGLVQEMKSCWPDSRYPGDGYHYHRQGQDCWCSDRAVGPITKIEITITELLSSLAITICLTFFIINFVFSGTPSSSDASF